MEPSKGALKKFSFSLNKKRATEVPSEGRCAERSQSPTVDSLPGSKSFKEQGQPSPTLARDLGFEAPETAVENRRAQILLSISDGQLEVQGGVPQPSLRIIPCRNPLTLSNYRVRLTGGRVHERDTCVSAETGQEAAARPANDVGINSRRPADVWGLQETKQVKRETPDTSGGGLSGHNNSNSSSQTELSGGLSSSEGIGGTMALVKAEPASQDRITDEEVAASLIAEARGERASSRVVPLLARNTALASIRQKYRVEIERCQRHPQQAGEPDKLLLQQELALLPEAPPPSSSAYEAMPVEEFGAAMLRGMGLTSIPAASPPVKRKAYTRAGLGSEREIDRLRERLEQQGRCEDAARKSQKAFIPLKAGKRAEDRGS